VIPVLLDRLNVKVREWSRERVEALVAACGGMLVAQANETRWIVVEFDPASASDISRAYACHPEVEAADFVRPAEKKAIEPYHAASNDALLDGQWALKRMGVFHAWRYTQGDPDFLAAVTDTGLDSRYADWPEFAGKSVTLDGVNGGIAAPGGYHGTSVAATVTGNANKTTGPVGVAPGCSLLMVRANLPLGDAGIANAWLQAAAHSGVKAISCSLGAIARPITPESWLSTPSPMRDALVYLRDRPAQDGGRVLVVNAMGNAGAVGEETGQWEYPGAACHALGHISVGAISYESHADKPARFSNHGAAVSIAAPGHRNWTPYRLTRALPGGVTVPVGWVSRHGDSQYSDSTTIMQEFLNFNGTSCATPLAYGVLALMWSANPALTVEQARGVLLSSADKARDPYFYEQFTRPGVGVVNAARAVLAAKALANPGAVYPFLQFFGPGVEVKVVGGVATTHLRGAVDIEIDAFSTDSITNVQLYCGTDLLYSGMPRTTWGSLLPFAAARLVGKRLKIVASTAGTTVETEYSDVVGYATSNMPPRTTLLTPAGEASQIEFSVEGANPPFTTEASWDSEGWGVVTSPFQSRTGTLRLRSTDALGNVEGG
jgi:hypothetical protein